MSMRTVLSKKPTALYSFEFRLDDGHARFITVQSGVGRFGRASEADALELALRRLNEQYGDQVFADELRKQLAMPGYVDPGAALLRADPSLHQSNYRLVGATRVRG